MKKQTLIACVPLSNAARRLHKSFFETSNEDWHFFLNQQLTASWYRAKAFVPPMKEAGWGRIIQISSVNGEKGQAGQTNYSAAKAGMHGFTMALAQELASKGVTVNTVAPGPIETELFRTYNPVGSERERAYLAQIPVRKFGQTDDLAELIGLILSPSMGYLTGQTIYFDGGFTVGRVGE